MQKNNQIYMPAGLAHGFCVLSNQAILHYNTSRVYDPNDEGGLIWDDKKIEYKLAYKTIIISLKDKNFYSLNEINNLNQLPK